MMVHYNYYVTHSMACLPYLTMAHELENAAEASEWAAQPSCCTYVRDRQAGNDITTGTCQPPASPSWVAVIVCMVTQLLSQPLP